MNRLLLVGHSHQFETRANSLLGKNVHLATGRCQPFGPVAVLCRLGARDRPDVALLGPLLSYQRAHELSVGLARLYPGVGVVIARASAAGIEERAAAMSLHLTPGLAPVRRPAGQAEFGSALTQSEVVTDVETEVDMKTDTATGPQFELGFPPEPKPELELDPEPVAELDRPHEMAPLAAVAHSHVIAVVSAKGGVGKTTIATNLAVGLAKDAPMSVVLIDADVQFGDVATALSLAPTRTLPDLVTGVVPTDTMVLKTYLTPHPSGFYVVCGAETPDDGDRVSGDQLSNLIRQLAEVFDFVIIDTAPGLGDHALAALELATDAVMVCDMSVPSIRGLRKELAVLASIGIMPASRHVVLNFGDRSSGMSVRDVELTIGVPVDVAIRRTSLIALSTNRGIPLLAEGTRNPANKSLAALVRRFHPTTSLKLGRRHRRVVVA